jgi:2-phosphosulfolactate phosphatase
MDLDRELVRVVRSHRVRAAEACGVVVVIDVIRAFSVAAYALAGEAEELWLVRAVEEAVALRERAPDALLVGEVGGRLIPGFDSNNSPSRMATLDVRGRLVIQRTGAGTQGAVGATGAEHLLVCALVNARATAVLARHTALEDDGLITLMPTAAPYEDGGLPAIEDDICADYLEALVLRRDDAHDVLATGIERLREVGRLSAFEQGYPDFPPEDVPAFLAADRFDFAMVGEREHWGGIDFVRVRRVSVAGDVTA